MRQSLLSKTLLMILLVGSVFLNLHVAPTQAYTPCAGIQSGDVALVDYTGTIESTGEEFDSGDNAEFTIAEGRLIQGFYEGMLGMKIGERKTIEVPPSEGYTDPNTAPKSPSGDTLYQKTLIFNVFVEDIVSEVSECADGSGTGGFGSTLFNILGWLAGTAVIAFIGAGLYFGFQKQTTAACAHCKAEGRSRLSEGKCGKCGSYYCRASFARGCPNCGSNTFVPNK